MQSRPPVKSVCVALHILSVFLHAERSSNFTFARSSVGSFGDFEPRCGHVASFVLILCACDVRKRFDFLLKILDHDDSVGFGNKCNLQKANGDNNGKGRGVVVDWSTNT